MLTLLILFNNPFLWYYGGSINEPLHLRQCLTVVQLLCPVLLRHHNELAVLRDGLGPLFLEPESDILREPGRLIDIEPDLDLSVHLVHILPPWPTRSRVVHYQVRLWNKDLPRIASGKEKERG